MTHVSRNTTGLIVAFVCVLLVGACAGGVQPSPTPRPAEGTSGVIVATLPPRTIVRTPTNPPPTEVPPTVSPTPITPQPTITSSGPTLDSSAASAKKIQDGVPKTQGPFVLLPDPSLTNSTQYGGVISYRTPEGAVYTVKYWLTKSPTDAMTRYGGIVNSVKNMQPLKGLGDEAMIAPAPSQVYIIVHWRNTTLELYRPTPGGTTPKPISDDDAIDLMKAVFKILSK